MAIFLLFASDLCITHDPGKPPDPSSLLFFIVIYSFTIVLNIFFKLWDHCNWLTAVVASLPKKAFIVLCFSIHYYPFVFFFSLYHVIGEANKIKIKLNKKIHVH